VALETASNLRQVAASKNLIFGGATSTAEIEKDAEFANLFAQQCGILVPAGELQWSRTRPNINEADDFLRRIGSMILPLRIT